MKRSFISTKKTPTTGEEHVDQSNKTTKENQEESSNTPQVKAIIHVKTYITSIPFLRELQEHNLYSILARMVRLRENLQIFQKFEIFAAIISKNTPKQAVMLGQSLEVKKGKVAPKEMVL